MRRWLTVGPGLVVVGLLGWWVLPADRPARVVTVTSAAVPVAPPVELAVEPPPPVATTTTTTEPPAPLEPPQPSPTTTAPPAPRAAPAATVSVQAAPPTTTTTIAVNETWFGAGAQGVSGHLGVGQPIWVRDAPGHCFQTDRESAPYVTPDPTCP